VDREGLLKEEEVEVPVTGTITQSNAASSTMNPLSPPLTAAVTKGMQNKHSWVWVNGWMASRTFVEGGKQGEKLVCLYHSC
jgi:hypothetical protein